MLDAPTGQRIPACLIFDNTLGYGSRVLYAVLATRARHGVCSPSQAQLAIALGVSPQAIAALIKPLVERRHLGRVIEKDSIGRHLATRYHLLHQDGHCDGSHDAAGGLEVVDTRPSAEPPVASKPTVAEREAMTDEEHAAAVTAWRAHAAHRARLRRRLRRSRHYRQVLERDGCCQRCGTILDPTVDHIFPLARGGTNVRANLQRLCRPCNGSKKDRP